MSLATPQQVQERLETIDAELAEKQNLWEDAALVWFKAKRERERKRAEVFLATEGSVAERNAAADLATVEVGSAAEASYEAIKAKVRVLETRATIGQSILRSQGRT